MRTRLERIWVVSPEYMYEGLGDPIGVFHSEESAAEFVRVVQRGHIDFARVPDYVITETYIEPKSLEEVESEDRSRRQDEEAI